MASIFDRVLRLFGKKPTAPQAPATWEPGKLGRLHPERQIPADSVRGFVEDQEVLFVSSSHVQTAQYFPSDRILVITYKGSPEGHPYGNVSPEEARSFALAPSKGKWLWQHVRIPGTKHGHQKPYLKS